MKRQNHLFLFISTPVLCLLLGLLLTVSHSGMPMEARPARLAPLSSFLGGAGSSVTAADGTSQKPENARQTEILLLSETSREENPLLAVLEDTLDEMRIGWEVSDAFGGTMPENVGTALLCSPSLLDLEGEGAVALMNWVEAGGRLGLMTAPSADGWIRIVGHKLGIQDYGGEYMVYHALSFAEGTLPVFGDTVLREDLDDYALSLHLESDCRVLMYAGEDASVPLCWTREMGDGRLLVCNHSLIQGKDMRGLASSLLCALEDVLVYPIINAGMVFIDDFPAPQPEGFDDNLREQYGLSTQGFFRNHWWPDMKTLARTFGLRYTGVLVETYNKTMKAPFVPDNEDNSLIRYYASELLQSGGELGLHGYNHQPLCLIGWQYADEDYITWGSEQDMEGAVKELVRYGHSFLPDAVFTSYVPPSNYLSDEGQAVLVKTVPTLEAISGVYLPEDGINARVQEYHENPDGTVPVPRITSGFSLGDYVKVVAAGEMNLHGVFSHFIHPDDVLDEERGALLGWEQLREDFEDALGEITEAWPALRWCTATEAAAAVQRFDRLGIDRVWEDEKTLLLSLTDFYDEAWLCLSAIRPARVTGAELYEASGCFWLRCTEPAVRLEWEAAP